MKKLLKEPLLHFVLIGTLIFLYNHVNNSDQESEESYDIMIDNSDIERLKSGYQLSWSAAPDTSVLKKLLEEDIKSEIFAREAKRLGLHHNDEIIKRRLVQKYEFLIGDVTEGALPTEAELEQFYQDNSHLYLSPIKYSFFHFYFKEYPSDNLKDSYILSLLNKPNKEESLAKMEHNTSFHLSTKQSSQTLFDLEREFGKDFADSMSIHNDMGWIDQPIPSGFGYHLVYITNYQKSEQIPLSEIKRKVIESWRKAKGTDFKEVLYDELKSKYNIRIDKDVSIEL